LYRYALFAILLNDTCVHHLVFRDDPAAAVGLYTLHPVDP
jgi:hypothetical protein